jgi:NAD(P)-dependent dehydrogenase (short-subunit alcohol dehydrogenase family)
MAFQDKIVVVTGGGSGIGAALSNAFADAGAIVVVVDLRGSQQVVQSLSLDAPPEPTIRTRAQTRHQSFTCDVTNRYQVQQMIQQVKKRFSRIDIYCSNAGIIVPTRADAAASNDNFVSKHSDEQWAKLLRVNLQSHVIAARELIPDWEQDIGEGHFLITSSAAGLLTMIGDAAYGVSKAAAASFAEHVAIAHSPKVKVHCLCPQAVDTPFLTTLTSTQVTSPANANANNDNNNNNAAMTDGIVSPEFVAQCCLTAISQGDFWIFPHPRVLEYHQRKVLDHARWLKGMQSLRTRLMRNANASAANKSKL